MSWTTIGFTECPTDCTKTLVSSKVEPKVVVPEIRVQVIEQEKKDSIILVSSCIEYDGGECVPVDSRSGFYSIITSETSE